MTYNDLSIEGYLRTAVDNLKYLSENYLFHLSILDHMKSGDFIIVDKNNELFKYPTNNSVRFQIDPLCVFDLGIEEIRKFIDGFEKLKFSVKFLGFCFKSLESL